MAVRNVTFTINDINGSPKEGAVLVFKLLEFGTATDAPIYLREGKAATPTASDGTGSIELWVNSESEKEAIYQVKYPSGEYDRFIVPSGVGDITLSDLVINHNPDDVAPQSPQALTLKADRDAGNIGPTEAGLWRTAIDLIVGTTVQAYNAFLGVINQNLDTTATPSFRGVKFNTVSPSTSTDIGTQRWNDTDKCIETVINANTFLQNGQELLTRVRNTTGSTILNGQAVRVDGSTGDRPTVALSQADTLDNASRTLGVATADIANNADGFVCRFGSARSINTNAFAEGSTVYVSPTVAGGLTTTKPAIAVEVGIITVSGVGNGVIEVSVDGRLPDIAGITPADGVFPVGDGTKWVGKSGDTAKVSLGVQNISGGANIGSQSSAEEGAAFGVDASATTGGAIGAISFNTDGFSGGFNAEVLNSSILGAAQICEGVNAVSNTIQFRDSGSVTATQFGKLAATTTSVTTTTYTALLTDKCLLVNDDTAGAAVSITIPFAFSARDGFELVIMKIGNTASVTIGNGIDLINGALTKTLSAQYDSIKIISNGTAWFIIEA